MDDFYDVIIMGGAFSGSSAAVLLRRRCPDLRVLVVERSKSFDRKVGEATTEVSGSFLTKQLCLTDHLLNHHISKQGLRFWFSHQSDANVDRCGEIGSMFQVRMPSYQVDREVLDERVLELAATEGAEVCRPGRVRDIGLPEEKSCTIESGGESRRVGFRWLLDASGRAAVLPRLFGTHQPLAEHPTNSLWARFRGVADLDGAEARRRFPGLSRSCQASRTAATNHLTGYGWWCWIIPLKGGDTSIGLVYDERLFSPPEGGSIAERVMAHVREHPLGNWLLKKAEAVPGDSRAYSHLPYFTSQLAGPGWQVVGDAAGFLDPLYSAGLDYCSWTVSSAVNRIEAEARGETVDLADINARFSRSYRGWFDALYKEKYHYLGDMELMLPAFLLDLSLFFFGPVRELLICPKGGFERFPFDGPIDGVVCRLMAFYNRRLSLIAQKKRRAGAYGNRNLDARCMVTGMEPTPQVLRVAARGIRAWLRAERRAFLLPSPTAP